jgi:hypothetical protein
MLAHSMQTLALLWLTSLSAWAGPRVELFPAVGTPRAVVLMGRVVTRAPAADAGPLTRNLERLTSSGQRGVSVELRWAGHAQLVSSGGHGQFSGTFTADAEPFPAGPQPAEARVEGAEPATATVDVVDPEAPFFVVSDFDDTIAVTHVLQPGKLLETTLWRDEATQPVVEGMPEFYQCLREVSPASPAFALVSGSPVQYGGRIASFLERHHFPPLGLYLRELRPSTLSNYKQPHIRALLKTLANAVVLIGDSGEKDPEVYAQMREEFKGRVRRIYIRKAGHDTDPRRFRDMLLFETPAQAARDAALHGLASPTCVEKAFPLEPAAP